MAKQTWTLGVPPWEVTRNFKGFYPGKAMPPQRVLPREPSISISYRCITLGSTVSPQDSHPEQYSISISPWEAPFHLRGFTLRSIASAYPPGDTHARSNILWDHFSNKLTESGYHKDTWRSSRGLLLNP